MPRLHWHTLEDSFTLIAFGLIVGLGIVLVIANTRSDPSNVDCTQGLLGEAELQELLLQGPGLQETLVEEVEPSELLVERAEFPELVAEEAELPELVVERAEFPELEVERAGIQELKGEEAELLRLLVDQTQFQELKGEVTKSRFPRDAEIERQWALMGEARRDGGSTIVAYVNGLPVTKADIEESRVELAMGLESTRNLLAQFEATAMFSSEHGGMIPTPQGVVQLRDKRAPIILTDDPIELMTRGIERIEQYGVDTVLLAGAVDDRAMFTAATAAGHTCDDADIAARVAQTKTFLAAGMSPALEGYLSAVDEEVYFTELLPDRIAMGQAVLSWRQEVFDDAIFPEDPRLKWHNARRDAFLEARVTLTNVFDLDTTVEDATAYMEVIWAESVPPTPTPIR